MLTVYLPGPVLVAVYVHFTGFFTCERDAVARQIRDARKAHLVVRILWMMFVAQIYRICPTDSR
jgi:hypothetical protein